MNNQTPSSTALVRNLGFVGIAVGLAWAAQVIGFKSGSSLETIAWILAAASLAGASMGLIVVSSSLEGDTAEI